MTNRIQAPLNEGVGLKIPGRSAAHENPQWYELDTDDLIEDPDSEAADLLPTARYRSVPEGL
jgi:hypothetical protein